MEKRIKEIKEAEHRKNLRALSKLRLMDDVLMRAAFRNQKPIVQFVLRIIMEKPDLIVTKIIIQADIKSVTGARSVIFDVYAEDSEGRKYNIEVQRADEGASPKRARYHSSVMDVDNLKARQDFSMLPETYTIIITESDYFKEGCPYYHFERMDQATGIRLEDGTHIIYVNGEYRGDDPLGMLMHDFNCTKGEEMKYTILADRVDYLKGNSKEVRSMCKILEDRIKEGAAVLATAMASEMASEMRAKDFEEFLQVVGISREEYEKMKTLKGLQTM